MEVVMEEKKSLASVEMEQGLALGKVFAESGVFPDVKSAAQGYIKILAGKELGLSPMQALNSFYFISGRLGVMAQTMGALVKKSGKYDYHIEVHTSEECRISFYQINGEKKEKLGESAFTIKDAAKAGIVNKDNWKNYPMNMLFARSLMNGIRWFCPDAVSAFAYSVEELQDLETSKREETIVFDGENVTTEEENGKKLQ